MEFSPSFASLIGTDQLPKALSAITTAIEVSFAQDGGRITQSEVRRRFKICETIYKELRGELKWGMTRIADHLPKYLRAELDGATWEPDSRACWMAGDGS